jgi:DNA-binding response OmpR family regulator
LNRVLTLCGSREHGDTYPEHSCLISTCEFFCMTLQTQSPLIMIVEDDSKTAALIESYLQKEDFATVKASDGRMAVEEFTHHRPVFVVLDVMLPRLDGFGVCAEIRKSSNVPILFLTARDEEVDCVIGLGLGADDYVSKPFSPRELVARVKAILRRVQSAETTEVPSPSGIAGLLYDKHKRRFSIHGRSLELTPIEFTLLQALFSCPGRVFLRNELLDKVYRGGEQVVDRVIDVHVGKLRQKIGDDPSKPTFIHTVRGLGYRFADSE